MAVKLPKKFAPLTPWFEQHRRPCWLPKVRRGDGGEPTDSRFGGSPWLADGEPWPACDNCEGPMSLFLQLNLDAVPEAVRARTGPGLLQAFFCTQSDCIHGPDEGKPFTGTHRLRVIDPTGPGGRRRPPRPREASEDWTGDGDEYTLVPPRQIVGWEPADDYPSMAEAEELGLDRDRDGRVVCKEFGVSIEAEAGEFYALPWARDNEKLGGWPGWANISMAYPKCRRCKWLMTNMIFQFGHDGYIPVMFGDGGQGHLVNCERHPRVLAYPWTCG